MPEEISLTAETQAIVPELSGVYFIWRDGTGGDDAWIFWSRSSSGRKADNISFIRLEIPDPIDAAIHQLEALLEREV